MNWASFGLGAVAVLLAAVSLTWQAVTFQFTGSRVRARLRVGVIIPGGVLGGETQVITHPVRRGWEEQLARVFRQMGSGTAVLELRAANAGRLAVGMENAVARTETGHEVSLAGWDVNPARGSSLEAGHTQSWYVPLRAVQEVVDTEIEIRPIKCWMQLTLGNEKVARTRESVALTPHLPATGVRT